ncbi:MAG TPA: hypothetical protein VN668_22375 [Stellaceae bacterium]|nr:hypothetical protein [Stellaceae bacterium]
MKRLLLMVCCLVAAAGSARAAGACDPYLRKTVRATGDYLPTEEAYARPFVFAINLDCGGARERVTVQRPTGHLPVCRAGQQVEVVGKLIWNHALVSGHYEINDPVSVMCR